MQIAWLAICTNILQHWGYSSSTAVSIILAAQHPRFFTETGVKRWWTKWLNRPGFLKRQASLAPSSFQGPTVTVEVDPLLEVQNEHQWDGRCAILTSIYLGAWVWSGATSQFRCSAGVQPDFVGEIRYHCCLKAARRTTPILVELTASKASVSVGWWMLVVLSQNHQRDYNVIFDVDKALLSRKHHHDFHRFSG